MQLNRYVDDAMSMHHSLDKVPDMSGVPMHVHDSCEIYHFISGNGYYSVEGNNYITELKGMEFIEQNFYFSRSYLNRIFKKATGSTILDYVIVKRLMKARNLILSGKPAPAALLCGITHF